jgi:hypothetical protein
MTQDGTLAVDGHLHDLSRLRRPRQRKCLIEIVVARHQMLAPLQSIKQPPQPFTLYPVREISYVPDVVIWSNDYVSVRDQRLVHFLDVREGALTQADDACVAEVSVCDEPSRHQDVSVLRAPSQRL